ncbi:MAG: chemotaxis protein CheC, partial [Candidatus Margulisiibacteriota bacterium]
MKENKLSLQIDALKEITTIGIGNAATAISQMLNKKIEIEVPEVKIVPINKIADSLLNPEKLVVTVFFEISNRTINGRMFLIFSIDEAIKLTEILLNKKIRKESFPDAMTTSVLKEIGNIALGRYLMAISEFLNVTFHFSVPK